MTMETGQHFIDLSIHPKLPRGWKIIHHSKCSRVRHCKRFEFDQSRVALFRPRSLIGGSLDGNKLREELRGKKVFNATLLHFYLDHPELIPLGWKNKMVYFVGTIYLHPDGDPCVLFLQWWRDEWQAIPCWFGGGYGGPGYVAVYAD